MSLKKYLNDKIEHFLTDDKMREADIVESKKGRSRVMTRINQIDEVKIADITFGYSNQKLIAALKDRGTEIAHNKFDDVRKEDEKIHKII